MQLKLHSIKLLFLGASYLASYILYFKTIGLKNNFISISAFFQISLAYVESFGTVCILQLNKKNVKSLMNNFNEFRNLITNKSSTHIKKNYSVFNRKLFFLFCALGLIKVVTFCRDIYKNLHRFKIIMYLVMCNYAMFLNVLTSILLMSITAMTTQMFEYYRQTVFYNTNFDLKSIIKLYTKFYNFYNKNNNTLQHFYALKIFSDFFELAGELYFGMFTNIIKNLSTYEKIVSIFVSAFLMTTKMIATVYSIAQNAALNKKVSS